MYVAHRPEEHIMRTRSSGHPWTFSRRQALSLLGAGAGAGLASAWTADAGWFMQSWQAAAGPRRLQLPKGAIIRTILKDVPPEAITGATLFHEHLSIDMSIITNPGRFAIPPKAGQGGGAAAGPPPSADVNLMVEQAKAAARDGVSCIVDGGHADMGRKVENLKQIAERSGVLIVASGGYYMERSYPPEVNTKSEDQLANELAQEATAQRFGAFGEIGADPNEPELTPVEKKVYRAIGKAHVKTGLPIFTHNAYGTGPNVKPDAGLRQLDVFESVGVKPQHIVIGHTCCLDDPKADVIKQIAKRGAFVGFDRVTSGRVPDPQKVASLLAFFDAGYADRLLLSSDFTGQRTMEGPGFGKTVTVFVPLLQKAGVKDETLHGILVDNPRRFLAFVPKGRSS
jgi:phosphotriesterase-related protein